MNPLRYHLNCYVEIRQKKLGLFFCHLMNKFLVSGTFGINLRRKHYSLNKWQIRHRLSSTDDNEPHALLTKFDSAFAITAQAFQKKISFGNRRGRSPTPFFYQIIYLALIKLKIRSQTRTHTGTFEKDTEKVITREVECNRRARCSHFAFTLPLRANWAQSHTKLLNFGSRKPGWAPSV